MKRVLAIPVVFMLVWISAVSARQLSVAKNNVNVRSGPGTNYEILWTAGKYYPVKVIGNKGKWAYTRDFEDDRGWIYRPLLKAIPSVIVKVPLANVREGAGVTFRVLFRAEKGVSFKLLNAKEKWLKVQHADGDVGWIYKSLVWGA